MNSTIYLNTLKKILKHKFVLMALVLSIFLVPLSSIESTPLLKTASIRDSYLVSFVLTMLIVTLTSPFPATISMSSRMDYMPLIVTRPIPRWTYVIAKWLALSTVIGGTLLLQQILYYFISLAQPINITPVMYLCDSIDRVLVALSLSSVITFVYLLPTELSILAGIVAIQLGAATHVIPISLGVPQTDSTATVYDYAIHIFEADSLMKEKILPILMGGAFGDNLEIYANAFRNFTQFMAPNIHTYDLLNARPFQLSPFLQIFSNISLALFLATVTLNAREFHYDTD